MHLTLRCMFCAVYGSFCTSHSQAHIIFVLKKAFVYLIFKRTLIFVLYNMEVFVHLIVKRTFSTV